MDQMVQLRKRDMFVKAVWLILMVGVSAIIIALLWIVKKLKDVLI